jgi:hypothetical protein
MQAERAALEMLKVAAIDYAHASDGGPEPLRAGAMLRLAAKAYRKAAHAVVDSILIETRSLAATQKDLDDVDRVVPKLVTVTRET